jgi:hypothetical protein
MSLKTWCRGPESVVAAHDSVHCEISGGIVSVVEFGSDLSDLERMVVGFRFV